MFTAYAFVVLFKRNFNLIGQSYVIFVITLFCCNLNCGHFIIHNFLRNLFRSKVKIDLSCKGGVARAAGGK
jgi:hypothetical protein